MTAMNRTRETKVITFGCRTNTYESEVIRAQARAAGLDGAVVVNTCAVTAEAERQARQAIRRIKRDDPAAQVIVTGCAAQIDPAKWAAMPEVARVIGNEEKMAAESYAQTDDAPLMVTDIMAARETAAHLLSGFEGRARAFVQVQQGCDHRCTFCVIPLARGPNRSVPLGRIVEQAKSLIAGGYREIILTGVDILSYGADLPGTPSFSGTLERLLAAVPGIERLRLTSLDPAAVDDRLLRLIAEDERLMPHIHLSAQAGDTMVLKRMKRRHSRDDLLRLCDELRAARADVALGADLIAGFPTETDEMAANTLGLVEATGMTHLHVFPYSARPGTAAARIPDKVPGDVKRARAKALREAGEANRARFMAGQVGRTAEVLVEKPGFGHSQHYLPVRLPETTREGEIVSARVTAIADDQLIGELS